MSKESDTDCICSDLSTMKGILVQVVVDAAKKYLGLWIMCTLN